MSSGHSDVDRELELLEMLTKLESRRRTTNRLAIASIGCSAFAITVLLLRIVGVY